MSGSVGVGGFEKGEFEGDSPPELEFIPERSDRVPYIRLPHGGPKVRMSRSPNS